MIKDAVLYGKLQEIVSQFVTFECLQEVAHGMDTQVNESFNNTFAWLAPKNKVYCGSQSLQNRLLIGVGINALGTKDYFERLFKKLGIIMTPNIQHYLSLNKNKRNRHIPKGKQKEAKKLRKEGNFAKTKDDEADALKQRSKQDGTYKAGQNLDGMEEDDDNTTMPACRKKLAVCKHCGKKGHTTTRSKQCLHYKGGTSTTNAKHLADMEDADNMDMLDSLPLVDDPPSDVSLGDFQDCGTWSEDDEEEDNARGIL
jgi:hypothetical protein